MIYELLEFGEDNAKTSEELARYLNICKRDIMEYVRLERLSGKPICSTCKGYFLPDNKEELKDTIIRLYLQAREIKRVADAMKEIKFF